MADSATRPARWLVEYTFDDVALLACVQAKLETASAWCDSDEADQLVRDLPIGQWQLTGVCDVAGGESYGPVFERSGSRLVAVRG